MVSIDMNNFVGFVHSTNIDSNFSLHNIVTSKHPANLKRQLHREYGLDKILGEVVV